jgi:hypothetical protein
MDQRSKTRRTAISLTCIGLLLALVALCGPAAAGTYCSQQISSAQSIIDNLDDPSLLTITGSAAIETQMRSNKAHDRHASFLINHVNRLNARCVDLAPLTPLAAPAYSNEPVSVGWYTDTVLAVHQATADAGSSGALANIGGVNRVINALSSSDNLYVMADRATFNADRRTANAHLVTQQALNFQSNSRPLTVIGGNFDASIPGAVLKVINGFGGTNLNLDFPMDAIYLNFHGMTLQQVYENTSTASFRSWLEAVIAEKYVGNTTRRIRLFLGNEGQYEYQMQLLHDWPATSGDTKIVDFRVFIKLANPCSGTWTASQYYPIGTFTKAEPGSINQNDSCSVSWGDHTAFDDLGTLCRYTYGAPGDNRIAVWAPIGTGICPTTATVYSQTSGPIVEGSAVDFVFNISVN